jgi:hypothetical protein
MISLGSAAQQDIVEVVAGLGRQSDRDLAGLGPQPPCGGFGGAQPGAGCVMIGENDDPLGFYGQLHLLEAGGRQSSPDGKPRAGGHNGEPGLDAFTERKDAALSERSEPHRPAAGLAQHHARLRHGRFCHLVRLVRIGLEISPMDGDNVAGAIAHDSNEYGVARLRLPVRQVEVGQQIGALGDSETATA